jgi:hypothetical protein
MKIETDGEYQAAIKRIEELSAEMDGPQQEEFFEINAAMVEYETRNHPALGRGTSDD